MTLKMAQSQAKRGSPLQGPKAGVTCDDLHRHRSRALPRNRTRQDASNRPAVYSASSFLKRVGLSDVGIGCRTRNMFLLTSK